MDTDQSYSLSLPKLGNTVSCVFQFSWRITVVKCEKKNVKIFNQLSESKFQSLRESCSLLPILFNIYLWEGGGMSVPVEENKCLFPLNYAMTKLCL